MTAHDPTPAPSSPTIGLVPGTPGYRRLLAALFLLGVATFAQLYSPQGLLPVIAVDQGVTADQAALMISTATLGLALGAIPWSYLGDAHGKRRAMLWAISLACVLAVVAGLVEDFTLVLVVRGLEGFMIGGVPALAVAHLSDEVDPRSAAVAAGTYISGTTVGGLAGRILAAPIGEQLGWRLGMQAVSLLAVVCVVLVVRLLPRPTRPPRRPQRVREAVSALTANLGSLRLWVIYLQAFLTMGGFVAMYNYLGFHLTGPPFGLPVWLTAFVFLVYLAGTWSSPWAGRLAARHSRRPVMLWGNVVMIVGVLLTLVPHTAVVILGAVVFTGAFFAAHAVATGWAGSAATGGTAQSASLYNLGSYAGSSVLGYLGGTFLQLGGWPGTVGMVAGLVAVATILAAAVLPRD